MGFVAVIDSAVLFGVRRRLIFTRFKRLVLAGVAAWRFDDRRVHRRAFADDQALLLQVIVD